jgi:hypothetical protein
MKFELVRRATIAGLIFGHLAVAAQTVPPASVNDALTAMATRAGVIFAGHVTSIDRAGASGYVDIRFRIDEAVKGCPSSGWYVLREWSGLWAGGADRYRVGQRLLMLLYARGATGMSSPVNGLDGAIPIIAGGASPLARGTGTAPADTALAPEDARVDLRWVNAQTLRVPANATPGPRPKGISEGAGFEDPAWFGPVAPLPSVTSSPNTASLTYSMAMMLLRGGSVSQPTGNGNGNTHPTR